MAEERGDETGRLLTAGWSGERNDRSAKRNNARGQFTNERRPIPSLWRKALSIITRSKVWLAKVKDSNCMDLIIATFNSSSFCGSLCYDVGVIGTDM